MKEKYNTIEDFIKEYNNPVNKEFEVSRALEFNFKNKSYLLTRFPMEDGKTRMKFSKILNEEFNNRSFEFWKLGEDGSEFAYAGYTLIGIYNNIYSMLDKVYLDGINLKDALTSDEVELVAKE